MASEAIEPAASRATMRVVVATTAEPLAADLELSLRAADPEREHFVIVQGPGMSNWIRREMVHRAGAFGGVEMPFLRSFMLSMAARASGCAPPTRGRDPQRELAYRIVGHARSCNERGGNDASRAAIEPFLSPLRGASGALDLDALLAQATSLAECFDRYEMDRPDLIGAWESNSEWRGLRDPSPEIAACERWQRAIWREVVPQKWEPHTLWRELSALTARLASGEFPKAFEPIGSITLFGVSSVPRRALEFLAALGRHRPVAVHMLAPTLELQERGTSAREVARMAVGQGTSSSELRIRELREEGNSLIASLGSMARESSELLGELEEAGAATVEMIERDWETPASLLGRLQRAMDRHTSAQDGCDGPLNDGSIEFHGVMSATRAAEVAHDEILRAFVACKGLRQEDVLILAQSIDEYAGAVEGVFRERSPKLALQIADRPHGDRSSVSSAVRALLALTHGDQPIARVRGLLEEEAVLERAGLEASSFSRTLDALEGVGARRFIDAQSRAAVLGTEANDAIHTLSWAVDRLLMGRVTGESPAREVAAGDVLAPSDDHHESPEALVAVGSLLESIGELVRECRSGPRTLGGWVDLLMVALDAFLPPLDRSEHGQERAEIESRLRLVAAAASLGDLGELPWSTACRELAEAITTDGGGRSFAFGGVTLARLMPMRSVPFRVVIVLGIQHAQFPRAVTRDGMDLAVAQPRPGDRSARAEDQLLLLETLHAARDRIRFIQRDRCGATGAAIGESAVIAQVIHACAQVAGVSDEDARRALSISHTALASSPEAWSGTGERSFDPVAHSRAVAHHAARRGGKAGAFVENTRTEGAVAAAPARASHAELTAHALAQAIADLPRVFLKARGIKSKTPEDHCSATEELVSLDPLDKWKLRELCVRGALAGEDEASVRDRCRQSGALPHGASAEDVWTENWTLASKMRASVDEVWRDRPTETRVLRVKNDKGKDLVRAWIEHLVASCEPDAKDAVRVDYNSVSDKVSAERLSPIDAMRARELCAELEALALRAQHELLAFRADDLTAWIKEEARALKKGESSSRAERMAKVRKAAADREGRAKGEDATAVAFRGNDYFEWGADEPDEASPRSLDDLARWLATRMRETRWLA